MITIGPTIPKKIPPGKKSFCSIIPVLKATAFGGVDTGDKRVQDAVRMIQDLKTCYSRLKGCFNENVPIKKPFQGGAAVSLVVLLRLGSL